MEHSGSWRGNRPGLAFSVDEILCTVDMLKECEEMNFVFPLLRNWKLAVEINNWKQH